MSVKGKQSKGKKVVVPQAAARSTEKVTPNTPPKSIAQVTPNSSPKSEISGIFHVAYTNTPAIPQPAAPVLPQITFSHPRPQSVTISRNPPAVKKEKKPQSFEDFIKAGKTVVQYFEYLVDESRPHYPDHEEHKIHIKQFYIDCFELIEDSSQDASMLLAGLKGAASLHLNLNNDEDLKNKTRNKQNAIKEYIPQKTFSTPNNPKQQKQPPEPKNVKGTVLLALQNEIDRLSKKLTHWFFKWFTWNKGLVQAKIDALDTIHATVKLSDETQIYKITEEIEKNPEEQNYSIQATSAKLTPYQIIRQHRAGYFGKTDTLNNLEAVFKPINRRRAC